MSLVLGVVAFAAGAWLLVESVERLVDLLRGWAAAAGVSGVALSALVLGLDLESTAAGVAATLDDLPGTALGTSIGAGVLLMTLGLGLAALTAPFTVVVPRPLVLATALAVAICVTLTLDRSLSRVDGAILLVSFAGLVILVWRGRRLAGGENPATSADAATGPSPSASTPATTETARPSGLSGRLALSLAGLLVGAELLVLGTAEVVETAGISETVFGLLVVGAVVSLEELVIQLLPAHRGFPELAVGNALGTLVFLLTGSLGVIALVRPVVVPGSVVGWHVPALVVGTAVALGLLARGRMGRAQGACLIALYGVYVSGALVIGG